MFLGLRTVSYPAPDLAASKAWYTAVLGAEPYVDESFHVGFRVAGYELALDPNADPADVPVAGFRPGALTDAIRGNGVGVSLVGLDEPVLRQLVAAAVDDADPAETMAPVPGPPGWTSARREAFVDHHRSCRAAAARRPVVEVTYAVVTGSDVVGALRLAAVSDDPAALEVGLWLGRTHRGRRIGAAALGAARDLARELGAATLIARTSPTNAAALALLDASGFHVDERTAGRVSASSPLV